MSDNPQDTLGLPPLNHYNQARSVRLKALVWIKVVHKDCRFTQNSTIPTYHKNKLLDYVNINIHAHLASDPSPTKIKVKDKIASAKINILLTLIDTKYEHDI